MFESVEVGNRLSRAAFKRIEPHMRLDLLEVQKQLAVSPLSVIVIIGGAEGAGKGELVNLLLSWMDARGIEVQAFWDETDEERERPFMWRFWRVLPPAGRLSIFFGSWYTAPIIDRVFNRTDDAELDQALHRITEFERMLADENVLVLKFWLHLSQKSQIRRLKKLAKDSEESWRISKTDWKFVKKYRKFHRVSERAIRYTNTAFAPWHLVEAEDVHYRTIIVTRTIRNAMRSALEAWKNRPPSERHPDLPQPKKFNVLTNLDQTQSLTEEEYEARLAQYVSRIGFLARRLREKGLSMVIVFEGPDAAGKGGAIRRLISALDARQYRVISVAAPTDEEKAHPYLWRFWRHIPRRGRITIFDRSWYGRVLVERIEGFCSPEDWMRAFAEINAFEEQLAESGIIVLKFYLQITRDEQIERFRDRQITPYKQYKITEEDWRNRDKWNAYEAAACEMIEKTGSDALPWIPVAASDKNFARISVMKAVAEALEDRLK
jgi:polyphosphate:AMP phosphotransferase